MLRRERKDQERGITRRENKREEREKTKRG